MDIQERKAFFDGYLWCNYMFDWDVTMVDLEQADRAYSKWLAHLAKKGNEHGG